MGLLAYTNYTVKIVECTVSGCAESASGLTVVTAQTGYDRITNFLTFLINPAIYNFTKELFK